MPAKEPTHDHEKASSNQQRPTPLLDQTTETLATAALPQTLIRQAAVAPGTLTPSDATKLQRLVGNRAVTKLLANAAAQQAHLKLQTKLTVGAAGDRYEQEADRVADQVLSMPAVGPAATGEASRGAQPVQRQEETEDLQTKPLAASIAPLVQRQAEDQVNPEEIQLKPSAGIQRRTDDGELQSRPIEGLDVLQRDASGSFEAGPTIESRLAAPVDGGSPLPDEVRRYMEPRFGADFSGVRIHTGSDAGQLSRALQAQAFTYGRDIYMDAARYDPGTTAGKRLLAHELTHVVQQTGSRQPHIGRKAGATAPVLPGGVIQRAWIGLRQLGSGFLNWMMGKPWVWRQRGNFFNLGVYHAHVWLDDGSTNPSQAFYDRGFGPHGLFSEPGRKGEYSVRRRNLNDGKIRRAIEAEGDPGKYSLLHNNCQDYVERVLNRYSRLGTITTSTSETGTTTQTTGEA